MVIATPAILIVEPSGIETIGIWVESKVMAEFHVDRNVSRRTTSEKAVTPLTRQFKLEGKDCVS